MRRLPGHPVTGPGRPREPLQHATEAGYRKHLRYGPPIGPDDDCGCRTAASHAVTLRQRALAAREQVPARPALVPRPAPPRTPPTQVEMAALEIVHRYARTPAEYRELLEMLGIVGQLDMLGGAS